MTGRPRIAQIITAPPGWFSVHADQLADLDAPTSRLVTLRPVAAFALLEDEDDSYPELFQAIVARDYSYGGVPSGFTPEHEDEHFIGYLAPGIELELFRGAIVDHYEMQEEKQKRAA